MEVRTQLETICHREIEAMLLEQNAVRKQIHFTPIGSDTEGRRFILSERGSHITYRFHLLSSKHHPSGWSPRPFLPNCTLRSHLTRSNASQVSISATLLFRAASPTLPSSPHPNTFCSNGIHTTRQPPISLPKTSTMHSKKPCRFPPPSPFPLVRSASPTSPFLASPLSRRR